MTQIKRFVPKQQRIQADVAAQLFDQINLFPEEKLPKQARAAVLNALHRFAHDDHEETIWTGGFTMISRAQTAIIWDAIRALPANERPGQVRHAFDLILLNLRQDTGEVMLTRDQFAEKIGCTATHVSNVMATLHRMGVIRREYRKIAGVRGQGMVVYFINAHVAWNGSLGIRKTEAAKTEQPTLRLIEGGAAHTPASPPT